jgi:hypothetical protein
MSLGGDLDLCKILKNTTLTSDVTETDVVRYLCNIPFSDVLDPCKNSKFPGTMVVSLSRDDLHFLKGIPCIHMPYKPEEIISWVNPKKRQIPPVFFEKKHKPRKTISCKKDTHLDVMCLDFGGSDGLFHVCTQVIY